MRDRLWSVSAIVLALVLGVGPAAVAGSPKKPAVDPQLERHLTALAAYDYGKSRKELVAFSAYIRARLNDGSALAQIEKGLDDLLLKSVSLAAKDFACRQLSLFGTDRSIPALKRLLASPDAADMARYALEKIPGEKAGATLRSSLKTSGVLEGMGILVSLGERRDVKAAELITPLLGVEQLAGSAAAALGRIGDMKSTSALYQAKVGADGPLRLQIQDALMALADQWRTAGRAGEAAKLYRQMIFMSEPVVIRVAGYRGLADSLGAGAIPLMLDVLDREDEEVQPVAIHALLELNDPAIVQIFSRVYPKLTPRTKMRVLSALRERGDPAASSTVMEAATKETGQVRQAALLALGRVGGPSAVLLLAEAAAQPDQSRESARQSLTELHGDGVDDAFLAALPSCSPAGRLEIARAIGQRDMGEAARAEALKVLKEASTDSDEKIRQAAAEALAAWPADQLTR